MVAGIVGATIISGIGEGWSERKGDFCSSLIAGLNKMLVSFVQRLLSLPLSSPLLTSFLSLNCGRGREGGGGGHQRWT